MSKVELQHTNQKEIELVYAENKKLSQMMNSRIEFVRAKIAYMVENGLSYADGDYYVFNGKGGLKIHETPKGVRKVLSQIAKNHNLSVVILEGVILEGDTIEVDSDGTIEKISIKKSTNSLLGSGEILAPYAVVSVYKDSVMIAKKLFIIPTKEYIAIKKMGTGSKFESMMAQKSVMKRVASGIYSLLGITLDRKEISIIDGLEDAMRVDHEENKEGVKEIDTLKRITEIKETIDLLDADAVSNFKDEVLRLYSSELDTNKKEIIKQYGLELKGVLDEINQSN